MATNSSPPYPWPDGTPGAEAPDPVAGRPGHFAWSRWIKQYVKNLNVNLMNHQDAVDPHPQYLTQSEGDGRYEPWTGTGGGGGVTAHSALTGLDADDHPQYLKPDEVLQGSNITVDRVTTPGSVIISSSGGGAGGATTLDELLDVATPAPVDGNALVWNESILRWVAGSGGAPAPARDTVSKTTAVLAVGVGEQSTITLAKGYRLLSIITSSPARVRLYSLPSKQASDLYRAIGSDPTGDHGLMFEFVSTASMLSAHLTPTPDGFDGKATPDGIIPITINNTGTTSVAITVQFLWIRTE